MHSMSTETKSIKIKRHLPCVESITWLGATHACSASATDANTSRLVIFAASVYISICRVIHAAMLLWDDWVTRFETPLTELFLKILSGQRAEETCVSNTLT